MFRQEEVDASPVQSLFFSIVTDHYDKYFSNDDIKTLLTEFHLNREHIFHEFNYSNQRAILIILIKNSVLNHSIELITALLFKQAHIDVQEYVNNYLQLYQIRNCLEEITNLIKNNSDETLLTTLTLLYNKKEIPRVSLPPESSIYKISDFSIKSSDSEKTTTPFGKSLIPNNQSSTSSTIEPPPTQAKANPKRKRKLTKEKKKKRKKLISKMEISLSEFIKHLSRKNFSKLFDVRNSKAGKISQFYTKREVLMGCFKYKVEPKKVRRYLDTLNEYSHILLVENVEASLKANGLTGEYKVTFLELFSETKERLYQLLTLKKNLTSPLKERRDELLILSPADFKLSPHKKSILIALLETPHTDKHYQKALELLKLLDINHLPLLDELGIRFSKKAATWHLLKITKKNIACPPKNAGENSPKDLEEKNLLDYQLALSQKKVSSPKFFKQFNGPLASQLIEVFPDDIPGLGNK